jgi:hypothetical protein
LSGIFLKEGLRTSRNDRNFQKDIVLLLALLVSQVILVG